MESSATVDTYIQQFGVLLGQHENVLVFMFAVLVVVLIVRLVVYVIRKSVI